MNRKEAYLQKLRAQLDDWSAEIDKLEAKVQQAEGEAEIQYRRSVVQLRAQQQIALHRLENLKNAGDEAWDDLKSGAEVAWKNLGNAVQSASARFD